MKDYEPLSGVDAAWLRMDRPTNLMTITAVVVLQDPMDTDALKALIEERFLGFTRFRQRIEDLDGTPRWALDPYFDLDQHVRPAALPGAADQRALQAYVSQQMSTPLDKTKPLWTMDCIEEYQGGTAIVIRLHHCIADGIALVQVLLSLTDEYFDPSRFPHTRAAGGWGVLKGAWQAGQAAASVGRRAVAEGLAAVQHPHHALERAREGMSLGAALSKFALLSEDNDTLLRGPLRVAQRAAWSGPLALERIKSIGYRLDAKVNDVLLGAVAGALRAYFEQRGAATDTTARALIPVNLRSAERAFQLGNHFGLVYLDLPLYLDDPIRRVQAVKRQMDEIKGSSEAVTALGLLEVLGNFPLTLEEQAVEFFSNKASAVITNVPGPREQVHMKGRRVQHIMPWVPRAGGIGLGISIFSYDGEVRTGIACDAGRIPDPETILAAYNREVDALYAEAEASAPAD
ncbi:wax ester/triacylglycerol synthase family O-acyltransferase [Salisaeta longa]|uniref:wax ester/triacylglycerol synthase family O-acyltransferase n=1 Tax=Salisaeta longa TaxID=503170 RepID=UPI0003B5186E|nr:wax ester/triacylglycerol synthase family O-acyltransferase [Salisaeta longa]